MDGAVLVDGGRIRFKDTKLYIGHCEREFFLTVRDAAIVRIENSVIDCNGQCGFLRQKAGRLLIEETEFLFSGFIGKVGSRIRFLVYSDDSIIFTR